jgi:hypothetical protein
VNDYLEQIASDLQLQTFLLRGLGRTLMIEDPRTYIHFIPWSDLTEIDSKSLRDSGIDLLVPLMNSNVVREWVLWAPPYLGFVWNHHLRTEDEVYEYNITKEWLFPDHCFDQKVVFGVRELDKTDFIAQLAGYWDAWVSFHTAEVNCTTN